MSHYEPKAYSTAIPQPLLQSEVSVNQELLLPSGKFSVGFPSSMEWITNLNEIRFAIRKCRIFGKARSHLDRQVPGKILATSSARSFISSSV